MLALILAQATENTAVPPDEGTGLPIIFGVLALIVLLAVVLWTVIIRRSRASKGGVEAPPAETGQPHPGAPPLESVEPRS